MQAIELKFIKKVRNKDRKAHQKETHSIDWVLYFNINYFFLKNNDIKYAPIFLWNPNLVIGIPDFLATVCFNLCNPINLDKLKEKPYFLLYPINLYREMV